MVIAQITTDNREHFREYDKTVPWFGTAPEALLQGFAATPEVTVHVLGCTQRSMAGSPEKLADNIWFHSLLVPKMGWLRTGYRGCIRAVREKLREIKPDIVHGQGTERECALSAVFSGLPNVLTVHGNMRLIAKVNRARPFSYQWLAARLESFTLPRTKGIVCISHYTQQAVAGLAKRTWVVPNAVDQGFFKIEPRPQPGAPVILCVGNVSLRKNQNPFIRALDPLAAQKKFRVVFVGHAGREEPVGREFFGLVSTRPWCEYAGFADREKLAGLFAGASMLALPSLEDNCPMAVLEAMAAGVPVVAAKVGGVPDLVTERETGLFCDPLDAQSMRSAVAWLLDEPQQGRSLAIEAKRHALGRWHPLTIARKHIEIYREVLKDPS